MAGVDLSVVVVSWNGREQLARCLPSVEASLARYKGSHEVIVVDNGSADGSTEFVQREHPETILVANPENVGFSPAANAGIRRSSGRLIVLVNNDLVCDPFFFAQLVSAVEPDDRIGSVAAQMRYLHDPAVVNSAGIEIDVVGRARDRHDGRSSSAEPMDPIDVFGASAGAALYRRSMLDEVGLFDERFFAYLEDVDLAWRAQRQGWRCVYAPGAVALHEFSTSSRRVPGLKAYLSSRNSIAMITKNASTRQLLVAIPAQLVLASWTAVLALVRRDTSAMRGLVAGLRQVPQLRQERKAPYLKVRSFGRMRLLRYRRADRYRPGG